MKFSFRFRHEVRGVFVLQAAPARAHGAGRRPKSVRGGGGPTGCPQHPGEGARTQEIPFENWYDGPK